MRFPESHNALTQIQDNLRLWAQHAAHPIRATEALLSESSNIQTRHVAHLWSTTFAITLILQLPVYKLIDIHIYDLEFHLPYLICQILFLYVASLSLYCALRIFRVPIAFHEVLVVYASAIVIYTPIYSALGYPISVHLLTTLRIQKPHDPTFGQILRAMMSANPSWVQIFNAIVVPLLAVMIFVPLGMFASIVANRSRSAKHRVMSATAFGMSLIFPIPAIAVNLISWLVIYVGIGGAAHSP